jgi:hypothetical protein
LVSRGCGNYPLIGQDHVFWCRGFIDRFRWLQLSQGAVNCSLVSFGFLAFLSFMDDFANNQDDRNSRQNGPRSRNEKAQEFDNIHL